MPVIPPGVSPFHIRPACTIGDDGSPTASLLEDMKRVLHFIDDERHLTAQKLLHSVQSRLAEYEASTRQTRKPSIKSSKGSFLFSKKEKAASSEALGQEISEVEQVKTLLKSKHAVFDKLEHRCKLFRAAQQNFSEEMNDEWIYASTHFGIVTYYRREEDGSLTIKLEGDLSGAALFEQICVLKEVDLHYKWSPFCTSSLTLADLDKLDLVGWFVIGMPNFGLARDGCYRAIGCDNIEEDGTVILTGQGVHDTTPEMDALQPDRDTYLSSDPILDKLDIPPVPTRMGSGRMTIRKFDAVIHITSPSSVKTYLVANINPNISFLPNSLLEYGMKHLTCVLLSKLQNAAKKAALYPVTNPHAIKMREEKEFYQIWLMSKFRGLCNARNWDMPPVAALSLSGADLHKAQRLQSHGYRRAQTYNVESPEDVNDGIVENMAVVSQSTRQAESESGDNMSLSALSNDTSRKSVWSNNPISSYLRETERKAQERKAGVIADSRRRAAERLQPKQLALDDQERLTTLKLAKYRRKDLTPHDSSTTVSSTSGGSHVKDTSKSLSHRLAYQLYNHKPKTRFWVLFSLIAILFTLLHSGLLIQDNYDASNGFDGTWTTNCWKDVGVIAFILLCAVPHFLLVDVSFIYAFDAMSLGSKTGGQAKVYYSDNVWLGSAVASFGIAVVSIALALKKVLLRFFIWAVHRLYILMGIHIVKPSWGYVTALLHSMPESLFGYMNTAASALAAFMHVIIRLFSLIRVVCLLVWKIFFQSNFIGKVLVHVFAAVLAASVQIIDQIESFAVYSIKSIDGEVVATPWRVEAFATARILFMNTAIFLLVILTLYYLSSQKALQAPKVTRFKDLPNEANLSHALSDVPSTQLRSAVAKPQVFEAIPEGRVANVNGEGHDPLVAEDSESAMANSRRRFRFLKVKASSSPHIGTTGRKQLPKKRAEKDRLAHSKSY